MIADSAKARRLLTIVAAGLHAAKAFVPQKTVSRKLLRRALGANKTLRRMLTGETAKYHH